MQLDHLNFKGLSDLEVTQSRQKWGENSFDFEKTNGFILALKSLAKEPMVLLLLVSSALYFITGNIGDGLFLAIAIILVAAISLFQDHRSAIALEKLKEFSKPNSKVIRNGKSLEIPSSKIVVGDYMIVDEGGMIPADGSIIHSNDFSVNESILTGESFSVQKSQESANNQIYSGTQVTGGLAIAVVTAIGNKTELGKIGKTIGAITPEDTPLEQQIGSFVKKMVVVGLIVFLIVWGLNYIKSYDLLDSLLKALTLAMSILPEEIPVAFTTFMAMGAWRLMKSGVVVKQMKTVETLGSATVICVDKTGTITENKMSLVRGYTLADEAFWDPDLPLSPQASELLRIAMWASEPIPFDPMEIELHSRYAKNFKEDERPKFTMVHEYPLDGKPPMMTHLFEDAEGRRIIAAKGAPEALIAVSNLSEKQRKSTSDAVIHLASQGFRILGVGYSDFVGNNYPSTQQELPINLLGLIAFHDPPKVNISQVLNDFYSAGISVKIITGDNELTTQSIAREIGFRGADKSMSGDDLLKLDEDSLKEEVNNISVFTRMFPEAKLRIINALKSRGEIVAMTGDGVNDGPALKSAHIGVAMGIKGTEIAKQSASLVLLKDDLSAMVGAIANGRKIYTNLKKAIQYIISIHIPIILTVFIPLALGWMYPAIFSPVHVILLELIMGPTCSIIYENEPMERNTMLRKPRSVQSNFFNWKELLLSIIQGLVITAGILLVYQWAVGKGMDEELTRALVFTTLIASNIFLTLVNRSFESSIFETLKYKNNLVPIIIGITLIILSALHFISPIRAFFKFGIVEPSHFALCFGVAFLSVIWFELFKWIKRIRSNSISY